ncbi:MAG: deoxyribose-phosphate aldolase [Bacteroidales bacterium]|nr:deoxyribose-phosphate aldolase [Bacteroidales bacterium]
MDSLLKKYGYSPDEEAIGKRLDAIAANIDNVTTPEILRQCMSIMDLTTLRTEDTAASVAKLVGKVNSFKEDYPGYPLPASVCVFSNLASVVKENLSDNSVHVTAVSGCFPTSQSFLEVKVKECEMAVEAGADEIDIVLALNSFMAGEYDQARAEIKAMRQAIDAAAAKLGRDVVLKVILETGLLVTPERIAEASFLAMEEGADFIKTSTGKVSVNATPMAAFVMCECIKAFYTKTGRKVGFKAAGGISTAKDAVVYYSIVKTLLGAEWLDKSLFRFGVSRLANSLMSAIEGNTVVYF